MLNHSDICSRNKQFEPLSVKPARGLNHQELNKKPLIIFLIQPTTKLLVAISFNSI
ncbi:hypothetical protein Hanom_Chr05g00393761 [Helianthus anomalus]